MKIIYLHGIGGSPNTSKCDKLRQHFGPDVIYAPPVDYFRPVLTIVDCQSLISRWKRDHGEQIMVVGSSMGGLLARVIGRGIVCKATLINPVLSPSSLPQHIQDQCDIEKLDRLVIDGPIGSIGGLLVALDEQDEIINSAETAAYFRGYAQVMMYPGGDHRFQHMDDLIPHIEHFIYQPGV